MTSSAITVVVVGVTCVAIIHHHNIDLTLFSLPTFFLPLCLYIWNYEFVFQVLTQSILLFFLVSLFVMVSLPLLIPTISKINSNDF